ncbi:MAG: hypothetical protein K8R53_16135 [Bacteroidales bacterium]|nr:hypothetical protein [Bacteroidales bacterium]
MAIGRGSNKINWYENDLITVGVHNEAGQKSIKFNANGLPGGIYFYRLLVGSLAVTRKMIIIH